LLYTSEEDNDERSLDGKMEENEEKEDLIEG